VDLISSYPSGYFIKWLFINIPQDNIKKFFKYLGPGLVTGAADDDPSGIATCSQTGAQFGFALLWTSLFMLPLMIAIQEACARIGTVKARGLGYIISYYYSKKLAYCMIILLLIANIINIGADLGSMAAALQLIIPLNFTLLILIFLFGIVIAQIFIKYAAYAKFLKWLCLFLFAYPLTIIIVKAPFLTILKATFVPHITFDYKTLFLITGLFGTTISPYMFFWQSSQEVEEDHARSLVSKNKRARIKKSDISRIRIDNIIGMITSQFVTWSIIAVGATVLHEHGILDVPLIFMIAIIARNSSIMGKFKSQMLSEIFIWFTFLCMLASALSMFVTLIA
jgi:NRAMP (natural resistance-associated macrophage protein)-like metal ion transporter